MVNPRGLKRLQREFHEGQPRRLGRRRLQGFDDCFGRVLATGEVIPIDSGLAAGRMRRDERVGDYADQPI